MVSFTSKGTNQARYLHIKRFPWKSLQLSTLFLKTNIQKEEKRQRYSIVTKQLHSVCLFCVFGSALLLLSSCYHFKLLLSSLSLFLHLCTYKYNCVQVPPVTNLTLSVSIFFVVFALSCLATSEKSLQYGCRS